MTNDCCVNFTLFYFLVLSEELCEFKSLTPESRSMAASLEGDRDMGPESRPVDRSG